MGIKRFLKKFANYILFSEPKEIVNVKCGQINYGQILEHKNIVITGGSRGLGYVMAKRCIDEGANVIISGRNIEKLEEASKKLGNNCKFVQFDISEVSKDNKFLNECEKAFNAPIDSLINNAGISLHEGDIFNVTEDSYDKQFNINLKGTYFLSKAFIEYKLKLKNLNGNLIIVSSETSEYSSEIPYGLTKAALNSLTKALAKKVYKQGLRVNAIAPGVTLSDMTKEYAVTNNGNMWNNSNAGRYFLPDEVAEVIIFLLSDASMCINGEIIHCNAGNHIK